MHTKDSRTSGSRTFTYRNEETNKPSLITLYCYITVNGNWMIIYTYSDSVFHADDESISIFIIRLRFIQLFIDFVILIIVKNTKKWKSRKTCSNMINRKDKKFESSIDIFPSKLYHTLKSSSIHKCVIK